MQESLVTLWTKAVVGPAKLMYGQTTSEALLVKVVPQSYHAP